MSWHVTLLIGIVVAGIGGFLGVREHSWIRGATTVPGKVVELIPSRGHKGGVRYRPRVQFTAQDGSMHEFVRGFASNPPGVSTGEEVVVAYDPGTYEGRILKFGQRFGLTVFLVVLGSATAILALLFILGPRFVPRIYLS